MHDHSHLPVPNGETRLSFLKKFAAGIAVGGGVFRLPLAAARQTMPKGGRVGWARMITPSPFWDRHRDCDPGLAAVIRQQTSVNLDPTCYAVDPSDLDRLCAYPFIILTDLTDITDPHQLANIQEYLKRGGFLHIEGCSYVNQRFSSARAYFWRHFLLFRKLIPGSDVRLLLPSHPIFRAYFPILESQLEQLLIPGTDSDAKWQGVKQAFYGVYDGTRMVAVVSLKHLLCGWNHPEVIPCCTELIANVYIYAMTR